MNLSNIESDINSVLRQNRTKGRARLFTGGATTTGDEGGGITVNDQSETDPEIELRSMLNVLAAKNVSN